MNYNPIFIRAVKAIQELDQVVKQLQAQIDARKQQIDRVINIIVNASLLNYVNQFSAIAKK